MAVAGAGLFHCTMELCRLGLPWTKPSLFLRRKQWSHHRPLDSIRNLLSSSQTSWNFLETLNSYRTSNRLQIGPIAPPRMLALTYESWATQGVSLTHTSLRASILRFQVHFRLPSLFVPLKEGNALNWLLEIGIQRRSRKAILDSCS